MAGLGGKNWSFQEEVTSSDVNGFLADQVVMRFADEATRTAGFGGSGEPTLAEGMVSYLDDSNTLAVYNGSAWVGVADADAPAGLQLVKTQVIGSAVSSVTVTGAFSADYDNYLIQVAGGSSSAGCVLKCTLGASSTAYYQVRLSLLYSGASTSFGSDNNAAAWSAVGSGQSTGLFASFTLNSPFLAKVTHGHASYQSTDNLAGALVFLEHRVSTSYTDFTLTPSTGTITGGTIRVYGYRNAV
jgi:hypothetical protein